MSKLCGLSVCMIVKNESGNLADALSCIKPFADEIVVVDTGSTDNTKQIAAQFTPNVFDFEWVDDFAAARNFAMSRASGSYHLWLDADDRVSPENGQYINSLKSHFDGRKAFYFILQNHKVDSLPSSCLQLRCTPLIPGVRFESRIHEQLFPSAVRAGLDLVNTNIVVRHLGYMDEETMIAKARRNLAILERERAEGGDHSGLYFFLALTHAPLGNKEEALHCMEAALERLAKENQNHHLIPEGYLFLANLSFQMKDAGRCLSSLLKAQSIADGNPGQNFRIGILYQKLGKHMEAVQAFRKTCGRKHSPDYFPSQALPAESERLLYMAYSLYCMNRRQEVLDLVNASAAKGCSPGKSWEWLGAKAFEFKNIGLALVALETAGRFIDLKPQSWANLALIYRLRGLSNKSEECLKKARA
jgi:tetratricopeptide (TPR) repeat protein